MRQHLEAGLLCAALAGSILALTPPAHADGAGRDYTLTDCDVEIKVSEWDPDLHVTTTTAEVASWTTEIWMSLPNPLPAEASAEVNFDLGPIATTFLPFDLVDQVTSEYSIALVDRAGLPVMDLSSFGQPGTVDADATHDFAPEFYDIQVHAGARELRPRDVGFALSGYDASRERWAEVRGTCDPLVDAPALMTQYVYDLDAPTDIITSTPSPAPGRELGFTAYHLLEAAPSTSDERIPALVSLGGWPMSSFPVDASGTVTGTFVVPGGLYGAQELRVVNGSRVAAMTVHLPEQGTGGPVVAGDQRPSLALRETFPAKVARGGRAAGTVTVGTPKGFRGTVRIVEGSRVLGTARIVAGRSGRVTLKRLPRGRHRLSLVWTGSDRYAGYQPTTRGFTVVQR